MTSSGVSQLDALYGVMAGQIMPQNPSDMEVQKNTDSFQAAFNQASVKTGAGMDVTKELEPAVTRSNESAKNHFEKNGSDANRQKINGSDKDNSKDVVKADKTDNTSNKKEVAKEIKEAADDVKKAIAEATGKSEEDVEAAMENLGMLLQDLLNADNIPQLVMEITGTTDSISLVTDENLMNMVSDITDTVKDLVANLETETGIQSADFADILSQMTAVNGDETALKTEFLTEKDIPSDIVDGADSSIPAEVQVSDIRTTEMGNDDTDSVNVQTIIAKSDELMEGEGINPNLVQSGSTETEVEVDPLAQAKESAETETVTAVSDDKSATEKKNTGNQSGDENSFSENNTFSQNLENRIENIINDMQAATETETRNVNAQDIIDQITDYMKLNIKSDMTELDMKLNPESLGTLHIKVAAKEGIVTAQFTAPNEEVKAILQSQISELTSKLEQSNVKIEAVEVTVESHAFEQNLEQNQQQNNQGEEEKQKRKSVRRLEIRPGMTLEEIAELDEEDQLTAEMMALEGNSVDYTA